MEPMADANSVEQRILERAAGLKLPAVGSLELSPLCNMNCSMCYVRLSPEELRERGRLLTADEWLALGREMRDAGVLFLLLTGGEPLLYPEFRKVFTGLKKMGFFLTLNTNGTLLNEEWADFFAQDPPRRVNITLYGADSRAYETLCRYPAGFEKTLQAVKLLKERRINVRLGMSLTPANYADLGRWIDLAGELGVFYQVDTCMSPALRERSRPFEAQSRLNPEAAAAGRVYVLKRKLGAEFPARAAEMIWQAEHLMPVPGPMKVTCKAGSCSFTVNWQGKLRPCVLASSPSYDVLKTGFVPCWEQLCGEVSKLEGSEHCNACGLRLLCRTCVNAAIAETGRPDGVPEYLCRYAMATYRLLKDELEKSRVR